MTSDKEGREPTHKGIDWPTHEAKRASGPRKEDKRQAGYRGTRAKKEPLGASKGLGGGDWDLSTVASKGR